MSEDVRAIGQVMMVNQMMTRSFLRILLLELDHQGFDIERFSEALYVFQDCLPNPSEAADEEDEFQRRQNLKEWGKFTAMVEDLLKGKAERG